MQHEICKMNEMHVIIVHAYTRAHMYVSAYLCKQASWYQSRSTCRSCIPASFFSPCCRETRCPTCIGMSAKSAYRSTRNFRLAPGSPDSPALQAYKFISIPRLPPPRARLRSTLKLRFAREASRLRPLPPLAQRVVQPFPDTENRPGHALSLSHS